MKVGEWILQGLLQISKQMSELKKLKTCKHMRFKMGIEKDNPYCSLCKNNIETLTHIFLKCSHTLGFTKRLQLFIQMEIDPPYRNHKNVYYITCSHDNIIINYLNIAALKYLAKLT